MRDFFQQKNRMVAADLPYRRADGEVETRGLAAVR
jgi:hypothetical protein